MDNLLFAFNTVLPLLLLIGTGLLLRRLGVIPRDLISPLNKLVFYLLLPAMLVKSIINADKNLSISPWIFVYITIGIILMFLILFIVVPIFSKDNRRTGVIIQGIARCNYAIFGLPLAEMLFPDKDISIIALLTIIVAPLLNILSAVTLEVYAAKEAARVSAVENGGKAAAVKLDAGKIFKGSMKKIVKNPLVISCLLGFVLLELPFTLPQPVTTSISWLSNAASPIALLILGASLEFKKVAEDKTAIIFSTLGKLVFCPAIFLTVAALLGFRDVTLGAVIIVFAGPTSVSSFPMAEASGADGGLAGEIVVFTSIFSIVSIFGIIFILKALALI